MNPAVVLDKCYLQGAPTEEVRELSRSHRLVMSDALFYELLTGDEPGRSRCFAKLPQTENPVELVNHVGTLIKLEIATHRPAGKPSTHREDIGFKLNPELRTGSYQLPLEAQTAISEQLEQLRSDAESFVEKARTINSFFPELLIGDREAQSNARVKAEQAIVEPRAIKEFYAQFESPDISTTFPPSEDVDESWAIYRWIQVQMLFGLDMYFRYNGKIPHDVVAVSFRSIEHDVLDAQMLMLGCLEGAFATRENKLIRWWKLLCPQGELFR